MCAPNALPNPRTLGRVTFAVGLFALGFLTLYYGDFALAWQPVPDWVPWRRGLVWISGLCLVAGGVALAFRPLSRQAAMGLTGYLLLFWVWPQTSRVTQSAWSIGGWLGFCETISVVAGAWILTARQPAAHEAAPASLRLGPRVFGACCVVFGLSHFVYTEATVGMIPAWIPARQVFAYLTGAVHVAAGVGLSLGIASRLAATLEALMLTSFVIVVHLPSVGARPPLAWAPTARDQWTPLFWALTIAASAWSVVASLGGQPAAGGEARAAR